MQFADHIVLLIYCNALFTNARVREIRKAGFVLSKMACCDRPKEWGSMGMQLAAVYLRRVSGPIEESDEFCQITRIEYDNPDLPPKPRALPPPPAAEA